MTKRLFVYDNQVGYAITTTAMREIEQGMTPVELPMTPDERAAAMYRMQRLDAGHGSKHDLADLVADMRKMLEWLREVTDE